MAELTKDEQIDLLMEMNELKSEKIEALEDDKAELEDELIEFDGLVVELSEVIDTLIEACESKGLKVVFYNEDKNEDDNKMFGIIN